MTGKTAPGRTPDYTPAHLLYALSLLHENRVGRKQLAELLRVGEGTVRTIISRLSDEGLIAISRPGITLSEEGVLFLSGLNEKIKWAIYPATELTVSDFNCIVLVRNASDKIRYGVEQRDQAMIHGAVGATTLQNIGGVWMMPGLNESAELEIDEMWRPEDNDVVIIGSGVDEFTARHGALSAALMLV